jgi:hypothetical protein
MLFTTPLQWHLIIMHGRSIVVHPPSAWMRSTPSPRTSNLLQSPSRSYQACATVSHSAGSCFSCSPQTHIRLNSGRTTTSTTLLRNMAASPLARLPCCTSTEVCHLQAMVTTRGHLFVQGMSRQRSRDRMHGPQAALLVAPPRLNLTVHHRTHLRRAMPPDVVLSAKLNYHERILSPCRLPRSGGSTNAGKGGGGVWKVVCWF